MRYVTAEDLGVIIVNFSTGGLGPVPHRGDFDRWMNEGRGSSRYDGFASSQGGNTSTDSPRSH
jgi:hypothetical protein